MIIVSNLSKHFKVFQKEPGFLGSIKSLFHRKYEEVKAVDKISFEVDTGEFVGFIGPNGAGKTTTLKMLSGILYPTKGEVKVDNFIPWERKKEFKKQFALVMGQKNQLWWDLPAIETFRLNKEIYEVSDQDFKQRLDELVELLDIKNLLKIQVRKLSLGQRMKCELIASLLHQPKILFLDEPTIGLDIVAQKNIRDFIKEYNKHYQATILLTSHYMGDVKEMCKRIIIINKGKIIFDGDLSEIIQKFSMFKTVSLVISNDFDPNKLMPFGEVIKIDFPRIVLKMRRDEVAHKTAQLLANFEVEDLDIEEERIEDVIERVFKYQG